MLEAEDASELASMEGLMFWHRLPFDVTDQEIVARAESVVPSIRSPLLQEVARWRIELRTVVAALRRRAAGETTPPEEKWGYGRWVKTVERRWAKPDFGLSGALPWVEELRQLIDKEDAAGVERAQGRVMWQYFSRATLGHYFDFEAVALYVLRWDLVHRWTSYDAGEAETRFGEMLEEGLGEYRRPFEDRSL